MLDDDEAFKALAPPQTPALAATDPRGDWLRLGPKAPPEAGEVAEAFPPQQSLPPVPATTPPPLEVVRTYPSGDEVVSDLISVSFNQPFGQLTTVGQQGGGPLPMQVLPETKGTFEWLGASTLAFRVVPRLPIATEFQIKVPAGAKAESGLPLAQDYSFSFKTPLPAVTTTSPYEGEVVGSRPVLEIGFNGEMDPQSVLEHVVLVGPGKAKIPLVLVPNEDGPQIEAKRLTDPVGAKVLELQSKSTVRLVPKTALKLASPYSLHVSAGIRSLEGPLPGVSEKDVTFETYSPLRLTGVVCGWDTEDNEPCEPGSAIVVNFNNDLKEQKVSDLIKVTPKVDELMMTIVGNSISISADFQAGTMYSVTVKPGLVDTYEQVSARGGAGKLKFGPAYPEMVLSGTGVVAMESAFPPSLVLQTMNLATVDARFYSIGPDEIPEALAAMNRGDYTEHGAANDTGLTLKKRQVVKLSATDNKWRQTTFDLAPYLEGKPTGLVLVEVSSRFKSYGEWERRLETALVQVTSLGLTTVVDAQTAHVLVSDLASGLPKPGVPVRVLRSTDGKLLAESKTDDRGLVELALPEMDPKTSPSLLVVAALGDDRAFEVVSIGGLLRAATNYDNGTSAPIPRVSALVFPERGAYRPGETVHMHAMVRQPQPGPKGDLALVQPEFRDCQWTIEDPRQGKVGSGQQSLNAFGTASLDHVLPKDAPLGSYAVRFECKGLKFQGNFNVQEFRTPEFKTLVEWMAGNENILVHRVLGLRVSGLYLFGAPMSGAKVEWRLSRSRTWYAPPGNGSFTFRDLHPGRAASPFDFYNPQERQWDQVIRSGEGLLDEDGELRLDLELLPGDELPVPNTFSLEAEVIDANYQSVSARASVVAHWAERYVGLDLSKVVVKPNEEVLASAVVTRIGGERLEAEASVRLLKTRWVATETELNGEYKQEWKFEEKEVGSCTVHTGAEAGTCSLRPTEPGEYLVRVSTKDAKGRTASAADYLWVSGESEPSWLGASRNVELISDKKEYAPGDVARVLVRSPFQEARGVVFLSREGVTQMKPVEVHGGSTTLEVPIENNYGPGVYVEVALFRGRTQQPGAAGDPGMPSYSSKRILIPVSLESRRIRLDIGLSEDTVSPGDEVRIRINATDATGRPVASNVALALVDEGVLSLTQYETPNPLKALYQVRNPGTQLSESRRNLLARGAQEAPVRVMGSVGGTGGGGVALRGMGAKEPRKAYKMAKGAGRAKTLYDFSEETVDGEAGGPSFYVRSLFATTAYFNGGLTTDATGQLELTVKMPDNLTRFRVMAVAANSTNLLGSNEEQITTRLPFMVRPSLPRFLNLGDQFDAMALVTNVSGIDTQVKVKILATNLDVEGSVKTLDLASGQTASVRFPAKAKAPGATTIRFAAVSMTKRPHSDAADVTLPTLVPATAEAVATYGVVDQAVKIPFQKPKDVLPQFGGMEVSLSSTALTGLQDALSYLVSYPFECTEQLSSRMLAVVSLLDVLADFKVGGVESPEQARKALAEAMDKLLLHARDDGGYGFWTGATFSWLHASAYALYALDALKRGGIQVPPSAILKLQGFITRRLDQLVRIKPHVGNHGWDPLCWESLALDSQALAVVAMARSGAVLKVANHLDRLLDVALKPFSAGERKLDMPLYAGAWLAQSLFVFDRGDRRLQQLLQAFDQAAVETPSSFAFSEGSYESLRFMWYTSERTTALVLQTLVEVAPDSPLIEKTVRGLVRARVNGRWSNTQANAFALLALNQYYRTFEKDVPDFVARIWLGEDGVLARQFKGRSMDIVKSLVPMGTVLESDAKDVTVAKEGLGRLYYRLGLRYAPKGLKLEALDRGFLVQRSYLKEDSDTLLERNADGAWLVKQGEYVRVRLRITAPATRYFAAVVDPMPAGLEAINEKFATSAKTRPGNKPQGRDGLRGWWGWWNPWNYEEKRDDRVQLFQDRMYGGVYEYTYLAKATSAGRFVAPPTRAEEMYEPETFGRSSTDVVWVSE